MNIEGIKLMKRKLLISLNELFSKLCLLSQSKLILKQYSDILHVD
jgi:hypothetical protein